MLTPNGWSDGPPRMVIVDKGFDALAQRVDTVGTDALFTLTATTAPVPRSSHAARWTCPET